MLRRNLIMLTAVYFIFSFVYCLRTKGSVSLEKVVIQVEDYRRLYELKEDPSLLLPGSLLVIEVEGYHELRDGVGEI